MAENRLLARLPQSSLNSLDASPEVVHLHRGVVIAQIGEPVEYVYFPVSCLLSLVITLENGAMIEAASVGNDGFVGISSFLGMKLADNTCLVQIAGDCLRLELDAFQSLLAEPRSRDILADYVTRTIYVVAQSVACNAFHPVQERLARWLLIVQDATKMDELPLTQDYLAVMLGVHRPTVTIAVHMLEAAGLIAHRRGVIAIVDRPQLMAASCECYRLVINRFSRL